MSTTGLQISEVQGWTAAGFEPLLRVFEEGFSKGIDKGAALSIYYKGNVVVNVWGGLADAHVKRPWEEETFGRFWSGTKYLSAVVIAHLVERGLLDYEERVCKYWPEFGQNGKNAITLDSLLSHSAGVSLGKETYKLSWLRDEPKKLSAYLASLEPLWTPGTRHGYSGFLIGLFLNEIVKRVDVKERTLSQYFQEEIAQPFDLDFHIGLPKALYHKASRAVWRHISKEEIGKDIEKFEGDWDLLMLQNNQKQPSDLNLKLSMDDPQFAALGCGSSHGAGTAKTAAKFAGIIGNGGYSDGKVMLSQKSIDKIQVPLCSGMDCLLSRRMTFARGVMVISANQGNESWRVLGHMGYGGQVILSDTKYKMGFAYCTNYMEPFSDFNSNRWRHLLDTFYQCAAPFQGITSGDKVVLCEDCDVELKNNKGEYRSSKL